MEGKPHGVARKKGEEAGNKRTQQRPEKSQGMGRRETRKWYSEAPNKGVKPQKASQGSGLQKERMVSRRGPQ